MTSGIEPDDLEIREFARRKVWAMTDPGTAERWDEDIASGSSSNTSSRRPDLILRSETGGMGRQRGPVPFFTRSADASVYVRTVHEKMPSGPSEVEQTLNRSRSPKDMRR